MKKSTIKLAGLSAVFLITASIASGGDADTRQLRISVNVPPKVDLITNDVLPQTGINEFSHASCLSTTSQAGAFRIVGSPTNSAQAEVTLTTAKGSVRVDNINGARIETNAASSCVATQVKVTYNTLSNVNNDTNNPVSLKIIPE